MTQPLALISQPDDEKNHLFLAAYLKPLHDSNMNQGLFLPFSNHFQEASKSQEVVL